MSQPTPLDQIDLLLAAWDERLRRMDENLVALESEAIYQILAGKAGKRPQLEGLTKDKVAKLASVPQPDEALIKTQKPPASYKGYFADELRNITFPGERAAAQKMVRAFAAYDKIADRV